MPPASIESRNASRAFESSLLPFNVEAHPRTSYNQVTSYQTPCTLTSVASHRDEDSPALHPSRASTMNLISRIAVSVVLVLPGLGGTVHVVAGQESRSQSPILESELIF